ncbi:hypothetical protein RAM80_01005 [Pseudomonas sp. App30]|uniref:hypothetical protein n=1 Tax=Pseudomonas sp. App30 TaxID=3068990 RepID=UPI003A7FAC16
MTMSLRLSLLVCCLLLSPLAMAQTYYPTVHSSPPQPFVDVPPQAFEVVEYPHQFYDSQLPALAERSEVVARIYDPRLGVYVDTRVPDPSCLADPAQAKGYH